MKIIIDVVITENQLYYSLVRKEYSSELVPVPSMEIEDPAWKEPRKIKTVTISPSEGYYHLTVEGDDNRQSAEQCKELQEMYVSHDWTSGAQTSIYEKQKGLTII